MSYTATDTDTYSVADVEVVVRRFTADIVMMAQSSRGITEAKAREYAYDVEALAKEGYLSSVDLTLLSGTTEIRAARYSVNTASGALETSRPGGVMWQQVPEPHLRILLFYNSAYTDIARQKMAGRLKINWTSTDADYSHAGLAHTGGRDYASNGFGMQRKDYGT